MRVITPGDVSVVVPVGGDAPAWRRAAESLTRLDPPPGELIAVIDGPGEAAAGIASKAGAVVKQLAERGGPARARNLGAREAHGQILLFLDADVEVPPELVADVAAAFNARPSLAAVIGSYDDEPGDPGFLSQYRNLLHHYVHQTACEEASTFWAGCGAVRRQAFDDVGGFDERWTTPSIEDIELGARLRRAGHAIRLERHLRVRHLKAWRPRDLLATDLWRRAVPWTELMLRQGRLVNDLNVRTRDRASVALALVGSAALAGAWHWPWLAWAGLGSLLLVVVLNAGLFRFFLRRRGVGFAVKTVPAYWTYLLTCAAGFAIGYLRTLGGRRA
jgi:GT2 family glycosyltransferase